MPNEKRTIGSLSRTAWISLLCAALLLVAGVGSVFAYIIIDGSNQEEKQVEVTFTPGAVTCSVDENTTVTNTGNVSAYVRAALILNWVGTDDEGNEYVYGGSSPESVDFTRGTDWVKGADGYYYYTSTVAPSGTTTQLVADTSVLTNSSAEYTLRYTIIAEAIQAEGVDSNAVPAISDAWGSDKVSFTIDPSTKNLTVTNKS